ncbi:hypothetical protein CPB83DRAFT_847917 [Crepidotus variabilis]|uniref:DRBM domain-containing protein n=1 Tax=Crepidotus variabilis TaxID=179855 RepID=A0A9P6JTS3_9AGAR|nr:hypothetical protein CPB83DRAFT_847917 [Crepidotus variabilis]
MSCTRIDYITHLNNYLQDKGQAHLVHWEESFSGPSHAAIWTSTCKISGESKGTGNGRSKAEAKNSAAQQTLERLLEDR